MFDRIRLGTLFLICLVVPFIGCGSSTELDSITVTPTTVSFGGAGLTAQLTAIGTVGHGAHPASTENVTNLVTWSTGSANVATVSSTGLVTSVGPGTIQITASINGFTGVLTSSSTITVTASTTTTGPSATDVTSVSIIPASQTVAAPGETGQFVAIGTTAAGLTENVTSSVVWGSSVVQVATINQTGLVSAVAQGVTTITAIATNPDNTVATGTATFTVSSAGSGSAEPIASVTIVPGAQTVASPGATAQYIALGKSGVTGLQSDITSQVTWSSSSTGIATVNPTTGLATAVGQGTTAITAIAKNPDGSVVTGSATLTVTSAAGASPEPISSVTIIPATLSVPTVGQTGQFIAIGTSGVTGLQSNITTSVKWSSSTPGVATIGASTGLATGTGQGTAAITAIATNPDGSVVTGTATFTVTAAAGSTPEPIVSISITPSSQTVGSPGATGQFIALGTSGVTGLQSNITSQVAWSSSSTGIATIGATTGLATAVGQGTTAITAIFTNPDGSLVTGTSTFTVQNAAGATPEPVSSITIIPAAIAVPAVGQTGQFIAIGTSGITGKQTNITSSVVWTSSTPAVATIGASTGLATGVSLGTTAITAIATNPDGSVVTGAASFTVTGPSTEPVTALTIVPGSESVAQVGQTGQLVALGTSSAGLQANLTDSSTLSWSTSNPLVAVVSSGANGGLVTATGVGTATITAIATNPDKSVVSATATFTVNNLASEPIAAVTIIPGTQAVGVPGESAQFIAIGTAGSTGLQSNITSAVTWSSSNPSVATITATGGLATGTGQGITAITAIYTNKDGSVVTGTATFNVTNAAGATPEAIASLSIIPTSLTVPAAGQTGQFIAIATSGITGAQSNVTSSVQWSSSTPAVATIGATTGLATGVSVGTTAITAIAKNADGSLVTATAAFTVSAAATESVSSLSVSPPNATVSLPGQTSSFIAIGTSSAGIPQNVTSSTSTAWTTSNPSVAVVSSTGVATATGPGLVTITAIYTNPDNSVATGSAALAVTNVASEPISGITVLPSSEAIATPNDTAQFVAIGTTSSGATQNLTGSVVWASSETGVATIGASTGLATGVSAGTTAITATYTLPDKNTVTGTTTLTVSSGGNGVSETLTALTISPLNQSLTAALQTAQFIAIGTSGITGQTVDVTNLAGVKWTSSIESVATITSGLTTGNGLATSAATGTTTITAEYTNPDGTVVTATAQLAVTITTTPEALSSLQVLPTSQSVLYLDQTAQFVAIGTTSTGAEEDLTNSAKWTSSIPDVATVNSSGTAGSPAGLATQLTPGTTAIIATATNADGTVVSGVATFSCSLGNCAAPTTPQLATLTIYAVGADTTTWSVTAPSTSTPAVADIIHCGPGNPVTGSEVCVASYPVGASVTITAAPGSAGTFGGFSSNCAQIGTITSTGSNSCTVTLSNNENVVAIFN